MSTARRREPLAETEATRMAQAALAFGFDAPRLLVAIAAISAPLDVAEIARAAAREIIAITGLAACAISRWDEQNEELFLWAEEYPDGGSTSKELFEPIDLNEYPASLNILRTGNVLQVQVNDPAADPAERQYLRKVNSLSVLLVPLRGRHSVLGIMEMYADHEEYVFKESDIALVEVLASHAGLAIERSLLLSEANRRAAEMEALRHASLTLTSGMELDDVFQAVLSAALKISPGGRGVHIFTYDGETLSFGAARWANEEQSAAFPFAMPRPEGLTYTVARSGRMLAVGDLRHHPLFQDAPMSWDGAIIGIPLKSSDRVVGVMNIAYERPRTLPHQELNLLNLLADQAAVAIDRALALKEARRRAAELEAVHQASLKLTASLNQDEVFEAVLNASLQLSVDALDSHIFTFQDGVLRFRAARWADGRQNSPWAQPRQDGLTYRVARTGQIITVNDTGTDPLYAGPDRPPNPDGWRGAIIGMPLKIGERVVGVMNVAYQVPRPITRDDRRALTLLADQAAVAIENARLHELVSLQALTDALTNLPNRRAFDTRLDDEIRRAERYKHPFAMAMMDMDGFKKVNDTFGHPVGDETLTRLGAVMREAIRDTDFIARMGGDEFALVLPETQRDEAEKVAAKIKQAVSSCELSWEAEHGRPFAVSISVGVAVFPADGATKEALMTCADATLYREKQANPR